MNQALQLSDPMKKVAIYVRVSTSEQAEEGYSIDEQLNVLRKWCERHNYDVYDEYADRGISGKNMNRPALKNLLSDAKKGYFDVLVVWKMNRLARNTLDLLQMVKNLTESNVDFRSCKENLETETPTGKLLFHMLASVSEFERDNIAENVKMGMIARAKEGSWNGGRVLGYDSVEDKTVKSKRKVRRLVINEKEAVTVRRVFKLYLQGNGYKSIANRLNREGYRTKRQGDFSINSVKTILENPIYVGKIRYNVHRDWTTKRRKGVNPNPIIQQGIHAPIISEDEWTRTVAILKQRSCKPNRVHSGEFPLTGIMRCPVCGAGMVLSRTNNKKKDGTRRILEYYVCGTWKNKGTSVCRSNGVRTQYADEYVLNKLAKLANNQSLIESIVHRINTQHASVTKPLEQERSMIQKELEEQATKKEKLLELYKEGIINKQDFQKDYSKINTLVEQLELRMEPLKQQLRQEDTPKLSSETVKHVMTNFQAFFQSAGSMEQRKFLLHLLIKQITIGPDRKIDTIQIQLNKDVLEGLTKEGESTYDVDSPSFSFVLNIT